MDFDEQTELFRKETGIWPPGRDMPSAMCGGEDIYQTRIRAYDYWHKTHKLEAENKQLKQGIIDDKDAEVVLVPKELYDQLERRGNRLAYFIDLLKLPSLFSKLSSTEKDQVLKGKDAD